MSSRYKEACLQQSRTARNMYEECRTHQLLIPSCIGGMTAKYLRCVGPWEDTVGTRWAGASGCMYCTRRALAGPLTLSCTVTCNRVWPPALDAL